MQVLKKIIGALAFCCVSTTAAHTQGGHPVDDLLNVYGGEDVLRRAQTVEYEWIGYYHGQYQSRYTEPPYDRLPVRFYGAVDMDREVAVSDNISTWPGELNMGTRTINDGDDGYTLNTISRIYTDGAMMNFQSQRLTVSRTMPWLLVLEMDDDRERVSRGGTETIHGITYDVLNYGELKVFVHPDTGLIYGIEGAASNMTDGPVNVRRFYTHYFEHDGIMVNRRYRRVSEGIYTSDMDLFRFRTGFDISKYLEIPKNFKHVESTMGYSGEASIIVRDRGDGVYVAGDGETQILYVEFDDHFIAIEAGGMPQYAENTYDAMKPYMNGKPLRYIIPTHHHDDHAVSVHFYARIGATILTTRDKEGFLRRLLDKTWGDHPSVRNARFEFIEKEQWVHQDSTNTLKVFAYEDGPHTANQLVGYVPNNKLLFTADVFIGWAGDEVRQGAGYGARHLDAKVKEWQRAGKMGPVDTYVSVHGRAYTRKMWEKMLATTRTITVLPDNDVWKTEDWYKPFGLVDSTVQPRSRPFAGGAPAFF